jgi:hypothetical protein
MEKVTLSKIEESINQLSLDEQLWLMERLAQSIRNYMFRRTDMESQLAAMANDPEIQNELREIEEEFMVSETNGLETT